MARSLLTPYPENATIVELKEVSRVGSIETATRCTAIQMLLVGASRKLVRKSLLVTDRALRKWINLFNQSGVDGLLYRHQGGFLMRWEKMAGQLWGSHRRSVILLGVLLILNLLLFAVIEQFVTPRVH